MLTTWGKRVIATAKIINYGVPFVAVSSTGNANIPAKTISGDTLYIPPMYQVSPNWEPIVSSLVESGSYASVGVAFGSGSTAATENDYTLENQVTGITGTTPTIVTFFDSVNMKYVARLDYVISNDTGASITISEIGLFVRFNTATTQGDSASSSLARRYSFLIDRTVLDAPVTIPNGDAATIRYEFAY